MAKSNRMLSKYADQKAVDALFEKIDRQLFRNGVSLDGEWPAICHGCPANKEGFCQVNHVPLPKGGNCSNNLTEEEYRGGIERFRY